MCKWAKKTPPSVTGFVVKMFISIIKWALIAERIVFVDLRKYLCMCLLVSINKYALQPGQMFTPIIKSGSPVVKIAFVWILICTNIQIYLQPVQMYNQVWITSCEHCLCPHVRWTFLASKVYFRSLIYHLLQVRYSIVLDWILTNPQSTEPPSKYYSSLYKWSNNFEQSFADSNFRKFSQSKPPLPQSCDGWVLSCSIIFQIWPSSPRSTGFPQILPGN